MLCRASKSIAVLFFLALFQVSQAFAAEPATAEPASANTPATEHAATGSVSTKTSTKPSTTDSSAATTSTNEAATLEPERGQILKSSGEVYVRDQKGVEHKVDTASYTVRESDTVETRDGQAVVKLNDGVMSVLDKNSTLLVKKTGWLSYIGGKIYFTFHKIFGAPKRVETPFSTIGIRGTTFIVYSDKAGGGVALKKGRLELESPASTYELHISRELSDFEAYKQQEKQQSQNELKEFEAYKKQTQQEFVEYRKSFILQANRVVRFSGNRVDETSMDSSGNAQISADFSSFENEAGDYLKQFRSKKNKTDSQASANTPPETASKGK